MAETILSYLLAEESSNPQRISKKRAAWESGEDGISLISLGRDGEWEDYKTKMSWTMHPEKTRLRPTGALGQVPVGSFFWPGRSPTPGTPGVRLVEGIGYAAVWGVRRRPDPR